MILQTLILILLVCYGVMYVSSRKYLETFQSTNGEGAAASPPTEDQTMPRNGASTTLLPPERPYHRDPIHRLDDYEMSAVFQNQGSKEASKKQISDAMTRYPMDWAVQGPASQTFQEGYEAYQKEEHPSVEPASPPSAPKEMELPDSARQEEEERKILQTYRPEKSAKLLSYSVDDVKTMVEKVFSKKGLVPEIVPSKQGQNIWEITEVREKNPTIVWEGEGPRASQRDTMTARGEEVISVPYTVSDMASGLDPFFQKGRSVRDGKYNYNEWTPGLERMFAPTHPIKAWH